MECIITISVLIFLALFLKYYDRKSKYEFPKPNPNKITIPGSWDQVNLIQYLKFYKIENPSKIQVLKIIGEISEEKIKSLTENQIDEIYYRLFFAVKTKPLSEKKTKNSYKKEFWYISYLPEEEAKLFYISQFSYYFFLNDPKTSYCGDEEILNSYKEKLIEGKLEYLSTVIASLVIEENGVYKKELIEGKTKVFERLMPITRALTVYKYFTGIEYADLFENNSNEEDSEILERRIPKHIRDSVWRRAQGKCEICSSQIKLEFDHIIPFSKGGSNTYRNIQLLCEKCNRSKSAKIG